MSVHFGNPIIDFDRGVAVWPTDSEVVLFGKRYVWVREISQADLALADPDGWSFLRLPLTLRALP